MLTRRTLIQLLGGTALGGFASTAHAIDTVNVLIGAGPGGGWDSTARQTMGALLKAGIISTNPSYLNKAGAAGTVALAEFVNRYQSAENALIFMGAVMVGGIALNQSPVKLAQTTPLARLTTEYSALAVNANSPYKTLKDFTTALTKDAGAMPVGGGSAGGVDHILLARLGQKLGIPAQRLNYIAQSSGTETVTSVVGGSLVAGISGVSEFKQFASTGRLRLLAVSSEQRLPGLDTPTFKSLGVDVIQGNWRGVLGAPNMPAPARERWLTALRKLHQNPSWKQVLQTQGWDDAYLDGDAFQTFLTSEAIAVETTLRELGLIKS